MKEKPLEIMHENLRNDLISDSKFQRKKALEQLVEHVKKDESDCKTFFTEYQVYILKCFRDDSEMCRELSIELMWSIIQRLNLNDFYLTYIFPVIVERIGMPELIEESEEIRLRMIQLMNDIIKLYTKSECLVPFLNDIIEVLVHSLSDKHPKVKQACCECIIETANALPKHFHMQCENLIKPLLKIFTHQHFRIRVIAVQAAGVIIMHGSYKALENIITSLAERLFDQIPQVRRAVIQVSAQLLMEYRDRYSYFHKILPLILTGLSDEISETRQLAEGLWDKVGIQYMKENEKDLKDQMDFLENLPPKTKYPRPNLGCRTLVHRNCTKICVALCHELSDTWQDDIKIRCGQLLTALILHAEANFTQNLQDVFPAMFRICRQNDDGSASVIQAAKLIGVFIEPKTWFKFVSEVFSSPVNYGHLRVLKAILEGCDMENLTSICDEVIVLLSQKHICHVRGDIYQKELIECCALLANCENCSENDVCIISLTVLGLKGEDGKFRETAIDLVAKYWLRAENSSQVCESVLETLTTDPMAWSTVSTDRCVFDAALTHSSSVRNLHIPKVLDMVSQCLCNGEDAEAKMNTFITLTNAISTWNSDKCEEMSDFYRHLAKDIILPSLVWRAGRSREALRTIALQCLCNVLESNICVWSHTITPDIVPLLVSLLEDTSRYTRSFAVRCISFLSLPDQESLIKVYQLLLSRLDDEYDVARLSAVEALKHIFEHLPEDFDMGLFEPHFNHAVDALLVHLDDDDMELKAQLMDTLETIAKINPVHVANKLSTMEHIFEDRKHYEKFIENITK